MCMQLRIPERAGRPLATETLHPPPGTSPAWTLTSPWSCRQRDQSGGGHLWGLSFLQGPLVSSFFRPLALLCTPTSCSGPRLFVPQLKRRLEPGLGPQLGANLQQALAWSSHSFPPSTSSLLKLLPFGGKMGCGLRASLVSRPTWGFVFCPRESLTSNSPFTSPRFSSLALLSLT